MWPSVNVAAIGDPAVVKYWAGVTAVGAVTVWAPCLVMRIAELGGLRRGLEVENATDIIFVVNGHANIPGSGDRSGVDFAHLQSVALNDAGRTVPPRLAHRIPRPAPRISASTSWPRPSRWPPEVDLRTNRGLKTVEDTAWSLEGFQDCFTIVW